MHRPSKLTDLPVELICRILNFSRDADLVKCTILTRKLRDIILSSSHLQYRIELAKHRMICLLPQSAPVSYVSRLKTLHDREHAWKTLAWKARHRLKLPPTGSVYEFAGGLYGNGKEDDQGITSAISFLELSPGDESDPSDLKMWTHPTLDVTIVDFTMDPSQDLLILITLAPRSTGHMYELHLRSLTTNEGHPKAPLSRLLCLARPTSHSTERVAALRVQVLGELVALLVKEVHDEGAHLEIWDWINRPQVSCKMKRMSGIDDFTFLSRDTFLLVRPFGELEVYTFDNPISGENVPSCQISYGFPDLSSSYRYWYITMSSNPTPGSIPPWPSDAYSSHAKDTEIHHPKPDERIHACCLYVFDGNANHPEHHIHCFVFFVNIRSLLRSPDEWLEEQPSRRQLHKSKKTRYCNSGANETTKSGRRQALSRASLDNDDSGIYHSSAPSTATNSEYNRCPPGSSPTTSSHIPTPLALGNPLLPSSTQPSHIPQGVSPNATQSSPPFHVPWSVWGPQNTRWYPECLNTDWQHSIYGLRTIEIVTPEKLLSSHTHPPTLLPVHFHDLFGEIIPYNDGSPTEGEDAEAENTTPFPVSAAPNLSSTSEEAEPPSVSDSLAATDADSQSAIRWRYLRLRDYNPYSVKERLREEEERGEVAEDGHKGKDKVGWSESRVVVEPSTLNASGVFKQSVTSQLPYVEIVSKEKFDVTDVMMDKCSLWLLKRHGDGAVKKVEVLTM